MVSLSEAERANIVANLRAGRNAHAKDMFALQVQRTLSLILEQTHTERLIRNGCEWAIGLTLTRVSGYGSVPVSKPIILQHSSVPFALLAIEFRVSLALSYPSI